MQGNYYLFLPSYAYFGQIAYVKTEEGYGITDERLQTQLLVENGKGKEKADDENKDWKMRSRKTENIPKGNRNIG